MMSISAGLLAVLGTMPGTGGHVRFGGSAVKGARTQLKEAEKAFGEQAITQDSERSGMGGGPSRGQIETWDPWSPRDRKEEGWGLLHGIVGMEGDSSMRDGSCSSTAPQQRVPLHDSARYYASGGDVLPAAKARNGTLVLEPSQVPQRYRHSWITK